MVSAVDLQIYLDVATEAALTGGAVLEAHWGNLDRRAIEHKGENQGRWGDLVTVADRASEQAILAVIQRHFPGHAILAEESGLQDNSSWDAPYLWAIDPLDGTTNYAHQYPFYGVSVGLVIQGQPQVGVVYMPFFKELFQAAQGLGATLNRQPMAVSTTSTLADSLLVTGFAYDRRETPDNNYREFCHLTHLTQGVRRGGSASVDLAYVACGRLDGYWERGLSPWDLAAGVVLVREAGGVVTAYDRSPFDLRSGRILATNGPLQEPLSLALAQAQIQPLGLS
jgi:myo-inositol-1(or 4)-monophosphatase